MFVNLLTDMAKLERITYENADGHRRPVVKLVRRQVMTLVEEKAGGMLAQSAVEALQYDAIAWMEAPLDVRPRGDKAGDEDVLTILKSERIPAGTMFNVIHARSSPGREHHVELLLERRAPAGGES